MALFGAVLAFLALVNIRIYPAYIESFTGALQGIKKEWLLGHSINCIFCFVYF